MLDLQGSSMNGVIVEANNNSSNGSVSNGASSSESSGVAAAPVQFRLECSNDKNYELQFESSATCSQWATTITNLIMDRRDFARGELVTCEKNN